MLCNNVKVLGCCYLYLPSNSCYHVKLVVYLQTGHHESHVNPWQIVLPSRVWHQLALRCTMTQHCHTGRCVCLFVPNLVTKAYDKSVSLSTSL